MLSFLRNLFRNASPVRRATSLRKRQSLPVLPCEIDWYKPPLVLLQEFRQLLETPLPQPPRKYLKLIEKLPSTFPAQQIRKVEKVKGAKLDKFRGGGEIEHTIDAVGGDDCHPLVGMTVYSVEKDEGETTTWHEDEHTVDMMTVKGRKKKFVEHWQEYKDGDKRNRADFDECGQCTCVCVSNGDHRSYYQPDEIGTLSLKYSEISSRQWDIKTNERRELTHCNETVFSGGDRGNRIRSAGFNDHDHIDTWSFQFYTNGNDEPTVDFWRSLERNPAKAEKDTCTFSTERNSHHLTYDTISGSLIKQFNRNDSGRYTITYDQDGNVTRRVVKSANQNKPISDTKYHSNGQASKEKSANDDGTATTTEFNRDGVWLKRTIRQGQKTIKKEVNESVA